MVKVYYNLMKNFISNMINIIKQTFLNLPGHHRPPLPLSTANSPSHNANAAPTTPSTNAADNSQQDFVGQGERTPWFQWLFTVIGVCFAIVSATLQALQTTAGPVTTKTEVVYIALVISLTAFGVSAYLRQTYEKVSLSAMHAGVLFGSMALMLAIVSNLRVWFMVTCIAIYLLGIFIIVFAYLYKPAA